MLQPRTASVLLPRAAGGWALCALFTLGGCRVEDPMPFMGECAKYPNTFYDYGEIGVGTCLSGPVALEWLDDGAAGHLLVANANPFLDYTGGSVLSLDMARVPLDGGTTLSHEAADSALSMPSFPGYMDHVPERDLLLVTNRLSADSRTRVGFDDLYLVDTSDLTQLRFAAAGEDGADRVPLMSDPDPVVYDPASGYAYVANLTSHTVSVVDALADPVAVVDATPRAAASPGRFIDADGSGSQALLADIDVIDAERVVNQDWQLVYGEGVHRVWVPGGEGILRLESPGDGTWATTGVQPELDLEDADTTAFVDPQLVGDATLGMVMLWVDAEGAELQAAYAEEELVGWTFISGALLEGRAGEWDERLGGPMALVYEGYTWLFYDGTDAAGEGGIGLALAADGLNYRREGSAPVVAPGNGDHDALRAADPYVIWDAQIGRWRMLYGAWDGSRWTVGHALSDDLGTWEVSPTPVFAPADADAAAPAWSYSSGVFRMVYARREADGVWGLGEAWSVDGLSWVDQGRVAELDGAPTGEEPPGPAYQASAGPGWGLYGETLGSMQIRYTGGELLVAATFGFTLQGSVGASFTEEHTPPEGEDGLQVDSWLPDAGLVYATLFRTTGGSTTRTIGVGRWGGPGAAAPDFGDGPALEGQPGAFDEAGVSHPVVFADPQGTGYLMLYAGTDDAGLTAIGLATSADGLSWSADHEPVLDLGEEWDSLSLSPGSVVLEDDGTLTLWYTGADGSRSRIGQASSSDGRSWARAEESWSLGTGSPGEFDDSAVRHPWVLREGDQLHLWYAGYDGETWRVGYATRADGDAAWTRAEDAEGLARAVLQPYAGHYDEDGLYRPVVASLDGAYVALVTGQDGAVPRVGLARGATPDALFRAHAAPTVGDRLEFSTWSGDDDDLEAISLERFIEGYGTPAGLGVSMLAVDNTQGFLYVASKLFQGLYVIDIRDDSTATWTDSNYLDLEALLLAQADVGATSFRGLQPAPDLGVLYALNGDPEAVMVFDTAHVVDDALSQAYPDAVVGWLPSPRGRERDAGFDTTVSIGPAQVLRQGDRLFVSDFNANTVSVYDLRLGAWGALVAEVPIHDENPHAMVLSPDGAHLAVACLVGTQERGFAESSVVIVDIDPNSDTAWQVVARISNQ